LSNQSEAIFTAIIANAGAEDATIILPGSSTATRKRYKYALTGQQLSAGDRVYVIPISGTYVLLGGAVAGGGIGGLYAFEIRSDGHLWLVYETDPAPAFSINSAGHLIYTIGA
jgi:hypothetical protein